MTDPSSSVATVTAEPPVPTGEATAKSGKPRGLWGDAWVDMRRRPLFWVSATLIGIILLMAAFPWLFTNTDPAHADLSHSLEKPSGEAWFGYDRQGRDQYSRTIHGARASVVVSSVSVIGTVAIGMTIGVIAAYFGRWYDSLLSRIGEVFAGLPFVLGAIVILTTFNDPSKATSQVRIMALVIMALTVLGWPVAMRIMRSSVLSTKNADYIQAARALGAGHSRIIFKHLVPNCLAPVMVYATLTLGAYVSAEATLSFLGIGLTSPVVSWGIMISDSQDFIRVALYLLLFPGAFLAATVLAFVMLGETVREALDPKLR